MKFQEFQACKVRPVLSASEKSARKTRTPRRARLPQATFSPRASTHIRVFLYDRERSFLSYKNIPRLLQRGDIALCGRPFHGKLRNRLRRSRSSGQYSAFSGRPLHGKLRNRLRRSRSSGTCSASSGRRMFLSSYPPSLRSRPGDVRIRGKLRELSCQPQHVRSWSTARWFRLL